MSHTKLEVKNRYPIQDHVWLYTIMSGFEECVIDLVASTTLQLWRLPSGVEVVVICAVAAIADGGAISVFTVEVVITALGRWKDLAVLAASRRHGIGLSAGVVDHGWQLSTARVDEPV
jgi:hypothetical protein